MNIYTSGYVIGYDLRRINDVMTLLTEIPTRLYMYRNYHERRFTIADEEAYSRKIARNVAQAQLDV